MSAKDKKSSPIRKSNSLSSTQPEKKPAARPKKPAAARAPATEAFAEEITGIVAGRIAESLAPKVAEALAGRVAELLADKVAGAPAVPRARRTVALEGSRREAMACTLYTKELLRQAVYPAIAAHYSKHVNDETKLKEASGLGLDLTEIKTQLFSVVRTAVQSKGCALRSFNSTVIGSCSKAGDIISKVWADLTTPV